MKYTTVDKTVLSAWLTKLYQAGYSQNTIHTTYARLKKVYNYFYNNAELLFVFPRINEHTEMSIKVCSQISLFYLRIFVYRY